MVKCLSKILLITISISFFISATEMNFGECRNTFFDEYDTYVKAEKVSIIQSTVSPEAQNNHTLTILFLTYHLLDNFFIASFRNEYSSYLNYNPPKLFLLNSVWRV